MPTNVRAFQIGSPRQKREGIRIGTVRFLPRGVYKADYASLDYFDVWLPTLAPSRDLLRLSKDKFAKDRWSIEWFFERYRKEMQRTEAAQTIHLLALIGKTTQLALGCYCEEESNCHRSELLQLIRVASAAR